MSQVRRLNTPADARVVTGPDGRPGVVEWHRRVPGRRRRRRGRVDAVIDMWHVDDAWWTSDPIRRIYYECQLVDGVRVVLAYDQVEGSWHVHR